MNLRKSKDIQLYLKYKLYRIYVYRSKLDVIINVRNIKSQHVQTAIVEWIESKFSSDLHAMVEAYVELQEIFQNKSIGKKQIFNLNKRLKSHLEETIPVKKKLLENILSTKKSLAKWKSHSSKKFSSLVL